MSRGAVPACLILGVAAACHDQIWRVPVLTGHGSGFQFDFQEYDLAGRLVEHVVFDAGFPKIGFSDGQLRLRISPDVTGTMT